MTAPDLFSQEEPADEPWHYTTLAGSRYRARVETRSGRVHVHVEAHSEEEDWTEVRWRGTRVAVILETGLGQLEERNWRDRRIQLTDGRYEGDFA